MVGPAMDWCARESGPGETCAPATPAKKLENSNTKRNALKKKQFGRWIEVLSALGSTKHGLVQ